MKEIPLLFSDVMVRALLAREKTQTRRTIKLKHRLVEGDDGKPYDSNCIQPGREIKVTCHAGDRIWVRETWMIKNWSDKECAAAGCPDARTHPTEVYLDTPTRAIYRASYARTIGDPGNWRRPMFMPRWASRISLRVMKDVRIERVQEITDADAFAEGIQVSMDEGLAGHGTPKLSYKALWESINAKGRGGAYAWEKNPWVRVFEFEVEENENGKA